MNDLRVSDIGEFELIAQLRDALPEAARSGSRVPLAIGDDAAVAQISPGEQMVVSSDTLNEGVHFRLDWTSWGDLGHKALAVNLSDLAAMGASPVLATVNLGLTGTELVAHLEELYRGIGLLAVVTGTVIAGGDVTRSPAGLSITVTVIGETVGAAVMRRDAGRPGDEIWVTGTIGAAAAGLHLLHLAEDDPRRTATTADLLIQALHRPEPRLDAGRALLRAGVRCAMDLSDRLAGDLHKIMAASGVDAEIDLDRLPLAAAVLALAREETTQLALTGGDDYELLFAAPATLSDAIVRALQAVSVSGAMIGRLISQVGAGPTLTGISGNRQRQVIGPTSFDHFPKR